MKTETPHGGSLEKSEQPTKVGCENWERVYCIQTRAETDPESLMTDEKGILMCPVCKVKITWGESNG